LPMTEPNTTSRINQTYQGMAMHLNKTWSCHHTTLWCACQFACPACGTHTTRRVCTAGCTECTGQPSMGRVSSGGLLAVAREAALRHVMRRDPSCMRQLSARPSCAFGYNARRFLPRDFAMACPSPIIVALDFPSRDAALALAARLDPTKCRVKVGKELFTRCGPGIVETLQAQGFDVFLDMKFHDIPNTTAMAVKAA